MLAARKAMMGASTFKFVGVSSGSAGSGTTVSATLPAGTRVGDLVLAFMFAGVMTVASTFTTPAGWARHRQVENSTAIYSHVINQRVVQAGDSSYSFSLASGTAAAFTLVLVVYRRALTEGASTNIGTGGYGNMTLDTNTVTFASGGILLVSAVADSNTATLSTPAGMTLLHSATGGTRAKISIFVQEVGAGATGIRSCVVGNAASRFSAIIPSQVRRK